MYNISVARFEVAVPWKVRWETKKLLSEIPFKLEWTGARSRKFHKLDGHGNGLSIPLARSGVGLLRQGGALQLDCGTALSHDVAKLRA